MRVLCIGCGSIGKRHIGNLLDLGCEVSAFDVAETAFHGLPQTVRRYTQAPAEDFDAFVIATPWDQHLTWAETAVALGKPFFVEKPLGTVEELPRWRALADECEARGIVTQVGYMLRFHEKAQAMKAAIPKACNHCIECRMADWPGGSYGPPLLELSHEIDLALWHGAPAQVEWTNGVDVCFADGWYVSMWGGRDSGYWRWWSITEPRRPVVGVQFDAPDELGTAMYRAELEHFLNAVRTGKQSEPAATVRDGIRVLDIVQQVEQMARAQA